MGTKATTLLHGTIGLDDALLRNLIQLLDGTRTRSELLEAMAAAQPETTRAELEGGLDDSIKNLYRAGMLEG